MAKEQILLEYQLVEKGGDKVLSTVTDITEAWDKSGKAATAALSEKQIVSATEKLTTFNGEVEKTAAGFTSAKSELNELTKQLTSGKLSGKDLEQAKQRAGQLKNEINNVRTEIGKLASDTRIFDTFVEGGRAVAAAFSVAEGAAALFGDENKDLQKSILKVQGALALLTGAQELANIATKKGGIVTEAYGLSIKVVEGIQKAFAISAAASWAIATAGISVLIAGVVALIYWYNSTTKSNKELTDSIVDGASRATQFQEAQLKIVDKLREAYSKRADAKSREIELLKAEGDTYDGLNKMKILEKQKELLEIQLGQNKAIVANTTVAGSNIKIWERGIEIRQEEIFLKKRAIDTETSLSSTKKEQFENDIKAANAQITYLEIKLKSAKEFKDAEKNVLDIENQLKINRAQQLVLEFERQKIRDKRKDEEIAIKLDKGDAAETKFKKELTEFIGNTMSNGQFKINDLPQETKIGLYRAMGLDAKQIAEQLSNEIPEAVQNTADVIGSRIRGVAEQNAAFLEGLHKDALQKQQELQASYFSFASSAASSLSSISSSFFQQETQTLQDEKDRQLALAGDNTKQREAIEKKFAIKSAEIKRKQAIADKAFALVNIGINTATAIIKQLSVTPLPAGAVFVGLLAAAAALQTAAVLAQPLPEISRFKKGVIGFKGKGTQTSDENLVMISNNESVMTGKATSKYNEELQAAQDLQLEDLIYHKYLLPALKQAGAADRDGNLYDDWLLRRTIKRGQEADRENSRYIVNGIASEMKKQNYYNDPFFRR